MRSSAQVLAFGLGHRRDALLDDGESLLGAERVSIAHRPEPIAHVAESVADVAKAVDLPAARLS